MKSNPLPTHNSTESLTNDIGDSDTLNIPFIVGDAGDLDAFQLVCANEVRRIVSKSKMTSSMHDLKEYTEDLLPLNMHIINCSLVSGTYPDKWKMALVVLLLKKRGLDPVLNNYRPISNLQFISKLTENAVIDQFSAHSDVVFPLHETVSLLIEEDILQKLLLSKSNLMC
jgi:hypothetical protein